MKFEEMDEGEKEEHKRKQRQQYVRSHRKRQIEGHSDLGPTIEAHSPIGMNLQNHQPMEKCDDEFEMISNVPVEDEVIAHKRFRERIDNLCHPQMCHVCEESYPRIQVVTTKTGPMCTRCKKEGNKHRFSSQNHKNPGLQPLIIGSLTQVEEMLIARASPILQVMHSIGGQYKYRGHTISFPQYVKDVANKLPRHIKDLDLMMVVRKKGQQGSSYDFTVRRKAKGTRCINL